MNNIIDIYHPLQKIFFSKWLIGSQTVDIFPDSNFSFHPVNHGWELYIKKNPKILDDYAVSLNKDLELSLYIKDNDCEFLFTDILMKSIPNYINALVFALKIDFIKHSVFFNLHQKSKYFGFDLTFDLNNWDYPYGAMDYCLSIDKLFKERNLNSIELEIVDDGTLHGLFFRFHDLRPEKKIGNYIKEFIAIFRDIHNRTIHSLKERFNQNNLIFYFDFPDEIKYSCSQYLVYFASFLNDLGLKTTTEIRDELSKTLFRIEPKDKNFALKKIKEALELYLTFPKVSDISLMLTPDSKIEHHKLISNIMFLRSQIELNKAVIQAKDATISAQNRELSNVSFNLNDSDNLNETFLDGSISLKKYEGKGFEINFPLIFKKLKLYLSKK